MAYLRHGARGAAGAVLAFGIAVVACSSSDSGSPGPSGRDAAAGPDAIATGDDASTSDISPPSMCQPADVSTFQPPAYAPASGQAQGLCTQAQADALYDACLGSNATQTSCDMLTGMGASAADLACTNCIFSQDTDPTHGPIIDRGSTVAINVAGCVELLDPSALACAKAIQAADRCEVDACSANCPVSDAASLMLYDGCIDTAAEGGCKTYEDATACADAELDGGAAAACFSGTTFKAQYEIVVALFCEGPADAGADAGADDGGDAGDAGDAE